MSQKLGKADKTAALKSIITGLHGGLSVHEAKKRFESEIGDISSAEIAELEQGLIDEGMAPAEIQSFCNVHALLFESALEKATREETSPSHPIALYRAENEAIQERVAAIRETASDDSLAESDDLKIKLLAQLLELKGLETHYARKEQVLFPYLEKVGFMGPSKVMWGKDDEVRDLLKDALGAMPKVGKTVSARSFVADMLEPLLEEIESMIFKEENILFPASLEKLDQSVWVDILKESDEVGYAFIEKPKDTEELMRHLDEAEKATTPGEEGTVPLPTGPLSLDVLIQLLNTLPVDLTFVDADDTVQYFSENPGRVFPRPRSIIQRKVQDCHPPRSLEPVERILQAFKAGERDSYEFWLELEGKFLYIRYLAVRDDQQRYLGCLEVTEDATHIRALEGEKKLLDDGD